MKHANTVRVSVLLGLLASASGCAERMGKNGSAGAMQAFQQEVAADPGQRPIEAIASRAVNGAVGELNEPVQRERIDAVVSGAADAFRSTLTEGLTGDLGTEGDGPLATSLAATAERSSAGAARGALTPLLAVCDPADPSCLDRRISDLSGRAAVAFADGIKRSIGTAALVVAFVAGAAMALLIALLILAVRLTLRGRKRDESEDRRRRSFEATAPHSSAPT